MVFILSFAPVLPPPPPITRFPVESQWIGWDGSVWDLHSGAQGVVLLKDGVTGLHMPRFDLYTSTTRAVPGHRRRGSRARARDVVWPVLVYGDTSAEWHQKDADFWHTIHPDKEGTWRITVGFQTRELKLTANPDEDYTYPLDPYKNGWARYAVELQAAQPFWSGESISRRFEFVDTETPPPFIPPTEAPPFEITRTRSASFAEASIPNPGDVAAYPIWTAVGPLDDIQLGVGSTLIDVPFNLTTGQVLRIDTDPRNETATLDGADATVTLGFQSFAAIEPGDEQPLSVLVTGTGSVTCELVPLYFRAF